MLLCYAKCPPIQTFFCKKVGSQDRCSFCIELSCIFFVVLSRIFHSCQKSYHAWISKSKNCQVGTSFVLQSLSLSPCHTIYLAIIPICFDLGIFLIVPVTNLQVVSALYVWSGAGFVWASPHVYRVIRLYAEIQQYPNHWSLLTLVSLYSGFQSGQFESPLIV